jgi:putative addiction module CopG family antidote
MNLSLTPDQARFVQDSVAQGLYPSADALIDEALLMLRSRDEHRQSLRTEMDGLIAEGLADIEANRWVTPDDAMAELRAANEAQKRQSA